MSEFWQRVLIAAAVIVIARPRGEARRLADLAAAISHPRWSTRYRVLRRTIFASIVFVGVMSALLVIPQVRAIAGGVLASSAVLALVIGFASQRTIGNFVAGILIAISQPLRLGDEVEVGGHERRRRGDRPHLHVDPHARQRPCSSSRTSGSPPRPIRNSTIRSSTDARGGHGAGAGRCEATRDRAGARSRTATRCT